MKLSNFVYLTVLSISILAFLASLGFEFFMGHKPCKLCHIQRFIYFCIGICAFLNWKLHGEFYMILLFSIALSGIVSGYHLLVQWEWVYDPCKIPRVSTLEDIRSILSQSSYGACSKISWSLLGFPISFYNLLISVGLIYMLVKLDAKFRGCHVNLDNRG